MKLTTLKKIPGVFAMSRAHVVSDGEMYSVLPDGSEKAVEVIRHGIRGTQNVNKGVEKDVSNIQITETARLATDAVALKVRFTLAFLDLANVLDSCAGTDKENANMMRETLSDFIARAKKSEKGALEVATRYAQNIAEGRWLWRNRQLAKQISVLVTVNNGKFFGPFTTTKFSAHQFGNYSADVVALGQEILAQLKGESTNGLTVEATLTPRAAGNIEVFPSQNYVESKPKGFSRPLYKINTAKALPRMSNSPDDFVDTRIVGDAAIRDQKLYNAIRTIDTWYPNFDEVGVAIPIEPQGASLSQQAFYRKGKESAFELFKKLCTIDPDSDEGMFCIAALDRGGVYGESDKEDKDAKAASDKSAAAAADAED